MKWVIKQIFLLIYKIVLNNKGDGWKRQFPGLDDEDELFVAQSGSGS